ncbi:hypothetical protein [Actinoplanes rectilineatus]|uniref:hypothetical protein n=1 Tax=Actinoplanes rectilineatus TaxID=113571 RepID=UPI0005F2AA75|nr:hypothetical protein [Actinoplanes rectilineatus]
MTDDDLRGRLRRTDPAASLPPIAPDRAARLLEEIMTTETPARPSAGRWGLAAAALVLIAGGGATWALTRPEAPVTAPAITAVENLSLAGDGATSKCAEPTAEVLAAEADFVFAGTVTAVVDGQVTLGVDRIYHGKTVQEVRVAQAGDASEQMMGSGRFETGGRYLVAAAAGTVMICGYSGEASTPGLADLYEKAF